MYLQEPPRGEGASSCVNFLLAVLIWQLASLLVCPFPCPKLALPCHCRSTACSVCISVSSFEPAHPPDDDHSLVSILIRMRSH